MPDAWRDLSDDELAARLIARGVDHRSASVLVEGRDSVECAPIIDEAFDG